RYPYIYVQKTRAVCGLSLRPPPRCNTARFAIRPKAGATPTIKPSSNIKVPTNFVDFNLTSFGQVVSSREERADETVRRVSFTLFGRKPLHSERPAASASRDGYDFGAKQSQLGSSRMSRTSLLLPPPMHPHWAT